MGKRGTSVEDEEDSEVSQDPLAGPVHSSSSINEAPVRGQVPASLMAPLLKLDTVWSGTEPAALGRHLACPW